MLDVQPEPRAVRAQRHHSGHRHQRDADRDRVSEGARLQGRRRDHLGRQHRVRPDGHRVHRRGAGSGEGRVRLPRHREQGLPGALHVRHAARPLHSAEPAQPREDQHRVAGAAPEVRGDLRGHGPEPPRHHRPGRPLDPPLRGHHEGRDHRRAGAGQHEGVLELRAPGGPDRHQVCRGGRPADHHRPRGYGGSHHQHLRAEDGRSGPHDPAVPYGAQRADWPQVRPSRRQPPSQGHFHAPQPARHPQDRLGRAGDFRRRVC
mmetsp:Transcript_111949/g.313004  ORF Transcript_111949/g.313004 Transcript_111949/m.313004 type:complete len:261 (-) Transcript_111949:786-1568(-)